MQKEAERRAPHHDTLKSEVKRWKKSFPTPKTTPYDPAELTQFRKNFSDVALVAARELVEMRDTKAPYVGRIIQQKIKTKYWIGIVASYGKDIQNDGELGYNILFQVRTLLT